MKRLKRALTWLTLTTGILLVGAETVDAQRFRLFWFRRPAGVATFFTTTFGTADGFTSDRTHNWTGAPCGGNGINGLQAGFAIGGNHASANSNCTQVLTAANYSGGDSNSRGLRVYYSTGTNQWSAGGVFVFSDMPNFVGTRTAHYYMRWMVRYHTGFIINTSGGSQKFVYWALDGCGTHANGCYLSFQAAGDSRLHLGNGAGSGSSADVNASPSWGYANLNGGSNNGDNSWHCAQVEVQSESADGVADGVIKVWYDGVLRISGSAVDYSNFADGGFSRVFIPHNAVLSVSGGAFSGDTAQDLDDFAFSEDGMPTCL